MDVLQVEGLAKAYGSRRVLRDVTFSVAAGEVVGLVGANGAGKSTLGDVVAGRYAPDAGLMTVAGHAYAPLSASDARHLGVGAVEQLVRLDPALTVARAVFRDTELADAPDARVRARARAVLADVGLDLDPDQLVADVPRFVHGLVEAARVLAEDTRLVVMDEVSAALTPSRSTGCTPSPGGCARRAAGCSTSATGCRRCSRWSTGCSCCARAGSSWTPPRRGWTQPGWPWPPWTARCPPRARSPGPGA